MSLDEIELTQSQLLIAGSLTGAATHELNNIMGILSLRLEKVQDDLGDGPSGDGGTQKDLAVMQRNLERAVGLIGHLQWLMRAGGDARMCAQPDEIQRAIVESIQTQQAIYERKSAVDHAIGLVNIRPVPRGGLHLFVIAALQRILLSLARGSALYIEWAADERTGGGRLLMRGEDSADAVSAGAAPRTEGVLRPILDLLAGQTERLAGNLLPADSAGESTEAKLADAFEWVEAVDPETQRKSVRLTLRLPAA